MITTPSVSSSITTESLSIDDQAWCLLTDEDSWVDPSSMHDFRTKHGLKRSSDLEYLSDTEIEELSDLLTTVPFRKLKKLRSSK